MNKVKSISLDDTDEAPSTIGLQTDATRNRAVQYTPQYAAGGEKSTPVAGGGFTTRDKGDKFQLSGSLTRFSQVLGGKSVAGGGNRTVVLAGVVGCLLIAGGLYTYLGDEYIDQLLGDIGVTADSFGELPVPAGRAVLAPEAGKTKASPDAAVALSTVPSMETLAVEEVPGNPYWKLPNPLPSISEGLPQISAQQSDGWRAGLNHPFVYQRHKATHEMRKAKVEGAVYILYDALAQKKFWTRMEAALGIAEYAVAIDTVSMRTAIGDARSDLVKNYFQRFRGDYTEASAHVMRQALRVVDAKARFVILANLAAHRSEVNDQYLMAASLNDADEKVKSSIHAVLAKHPVPAAFQAAYKTSMAAEAVVIKKPLKKESGEIKVEKIPANMNIEEVYFINDEPDANLEAAPLPVEKKKEDDGFNDLEHTEKEGVPPGQ